MRSIIEKSGNDGLNTPKVSYVVRLSAILKEYVGLSENVELNPEET
jgi:hypothetical protein